METATTTIPEPVTQQEASKPTMRAAIHERFGPPSTVEIRTVEKPVPGDDELLVRVRAASINISDWYAATGRPLLGRFAMGLRKPKETRLGVDYAGVVEAVGKDVTEFKAGDEVFGGRTGAYAEYVAAKADRGVAHKPANVSFEEAAAVPVAALTALQALRDHGKLEPGQKVLVNGASGGVGTYAVQIAKALGAGHMTAVCSTRNVETARSLGADRVIDYTQEDFTQLDDRFDLMLDVAGSRPWRHVKHVLAPNATVVMIGGPRKSRLLGPMGHLARFRIAAIGSGRKVLFFVAKFNKPDMETLRDLLASGQIRSVLDPQYPLSELPAALDVMGEGHCRGKIVVTI
jgi:NADPH:quinone reductase-like Zn-dependent oxidoreductase